MLLGTCSPGALLARLAVAVPAAVTLGVTLPSPASAQILQLNPEPTQGMNLSVYTPNYISFILPSSSTIGNTQSSGMQSGIYGNAAYTWTLSNSGTIFANFGASAPVTAGVSFLNGGRITNTGRISGAQTIGVRIAGSTGTLINAGSIYGYRIGANFLAGGTITNNAGGTITGRNIASATLSNSSRAISISGAIGRVTNAGSLNAVYGVSLGAGGTVTNQSTGRITALQDGVNIAGGVGTVTNVGSITGTAGYGVRFLDNSGGTVINSGRITGGVAAVKFGNGTNRLVINAGGAFTGNVIGGTASNTLELATGVGTGTLSGLGTSFTNFGTVTVDSGATWLMSGTNTVGAGVTLTATGTLAFDGTLTNAGTIIGSSGTAVNFGAGNDLLILQSGFAFTGLVNGGAGVNTLELQSATGSITGLGVSFTNFGIVAVDSGAAWTFAGANTIASGQTLNNSGQAYVSGVLTNAGTIVGASAGVANVTLTGAGTLSNSGQITSTGTAVAGATASNGLVLNTGTIQSSGTYGVRLGGAGTVTNSGGSALISGATYGVRVNGAGPVTNSGVITGTTDTGVVFGLGGTLGNTGTITGGRRAVFMGAAGTVTNSGLLSGNAFAGAGNAGVHLGAGGTVNNQAGGTITGSNGVVFGASTAQGVLINAGTVTGTGSGVGNATVPSGYGATFLLGGTLQNTGLIQGVAAGASLAYGSVTNSGTITGTGTGTAANGGSPLNLGAGIVFTDAQGVFNNTVVNSGTISASGAGLAIQFGAGNDLLTLLPGSIITGVSDGGGGTNTLQLGGSTSGSLNGFGSNFVNFSTVTLANGAIWSFSGGANTINSGVTFNNSGSLTVSGTLTNLGSMAGSGVLSSSGSLINSGVVSQTVTLTGGTLTNQAAGQITGGVVGTASGEIDNAGLISGSGAAIALQSGGLVSNSGTITGVTGVSVSGGNVTIANSGTIVGTGGTAVQFGAGDDVLRILSGGVLVGAVDGGAGSNTLEYVDGSGTVGNFTNFDSLGIGATGSWIINADRTVATLTNAGTLANSATLSNANAFINTGTFLNTGVLIESGVLTNSGVFSGGVQLASSGQVVNQAGGVITATGTAISGTGGGQTVTNAGSIQGAVGIALTGTLGNTVVNSGSIVGTGGTAVQFGAGDDLLVLQTGSSLTGVADGGAGANQLALAGTGSLTGLGTNFVNFSGVQLYSGATWSFTGHNTVGAGVSLSNAGVLTNTGTLGNAGAISGSGTFKNSGLLVNSGSISQRVDLTGAGAITNQSSGVLSGGLLAASGGIGTIDNAGLISSSGTAITLQGGGAVSNSGAITGLVGVDISGGGGTLVNSGTIVGTGGTAVQFGAGSDLLQVLAGAAFTGTVDGGGGANTLEFVSGSGSLANFTNFGNVVVDSGASWTLTGANTTVVLTNAGTLGNSGTLTNTGSFTNSGRLVNTGRLIETGVLTNTGRIEGKVELAGAGSLNNQAGGAIVSTTTAVESSGAARALSNAGSIQGVTGIVFSDAGGTFDNTLYNSGTITGTGGTAVQFGAGSDLLVLQVGGVFDGIVSGGGGVNTLVLANGATSVTGLGVQYVDFQIVSIATTTNATLTGYNSVGIGETLSNGGTLTVAGTLANLGSILNVGGLEVSGLLSNSGAISGGVKLSGTGAFDNQAGGGLVASGVAVNATGGAHLVSNAGSIQGVTGIVFSDTGGTFANTVVNSGSIVGTGGTAVQFGAGADKLVLQVGSVLTGVADGGAGANTLELAGAGSGTITNFATKFLNFSTVNLDSGGSWTFAGGTTLASGVAVANAGTLVNTGTFANAGSITGAGVFGNAGQLTNSGVIAQAVTLDGAGAVTNAATGTITGGVGGGAGGNLVNNAGTIGGAASVGVGLAQGGTITNTGLITGTSAGVKIDGGQVLITNNGVISGTGASGVGVLFTGGASGTIDNFGTISGAGGTAVKFAGGTNKLILESGGVLIGAADGSLGVNTLLVQGSAQLAQVQVIGFQYVGFLNPTQQIDANSTISNPTALSGTLVNQGTLTGTVTVNSGATLANGGVVSIDEASTNGGVFTNTGSVTNHDTLTNAGGLTNSGQFTNSGVVDNTGSLSNSGTISGSGALLTSGSLTNTGVVTSNVTGITGDGVIFNSGTIVGTSDTGVNLTAGGTLINTATGFIQGGQYGAKVGAGASVSNAGVIIDDDIAGVTLASNASLMNDTTGKVTGATGVIFTGTGASLTNRGTITGTTGVAIQFGAGVNNLTLDTGSTLVGAINGGGGAGRIALTGTGSMTNAITNFGAGSALTIGAGAAWTASGNWSVASVTNSGTLQPGASGSPLRVTGNYVQTSTGVLRVAADASGASSQLLVTGTAAVAGSVVVAAADGSYQPETRYTILTSSGLTGQFSGVTTNLAFLTPTLSYDAVNAYLTLARSADFSTAAVNPNQVNTAVALQAGGRNSTLYKAVVGQSTSGAQAAFDALSGEAYASTNSVLLADSRLIRQGVLSRMRQGLNGGLAPLGAGSTQATSGDGTVGWGEIHGDFGHLGSDDVAAHVRLNSVGFATGVDTEFAGGWRIGAAVGYARSDSDVDSRLSQARIDTTSVAVYGGRAFGPLSVRLAGAYGWNDISARRTAAFPGFTDTLRADYSANTAQAFGEVAYGLAFGGVAVEPFAGAAYVKVDSDAVREKGGAAALNLQGDKVDVGYSTVGARFAKAWVVGENAVLTPRASLAWQHTFGDLTPGARATFQETGVAFSVTGAPLARDAALVEAGADLKVGARLKVGVSYQGGLSKNAVDNRMQVRFDWAF